MMGLMSGMSKIQRVGVVLNRHLGQACTGISQAVGRKLESAGHCRWGERAIAIGLLLCLSCLSFAGAAAAEDYTKRDLKGMDFSGRDLTDSQFNQAVLEEPALSHTNLAGVRMFGAVMKRANLEGANLSYATLDTADFRLANLTNVIFEGAYAFNTRFAGATIDGADFTDVLLRPDAEKLLCEVAKGTNPVTGRDTRETLYCP